MSAFNGVGIPRGQLATSFHTNTDYNNAQDFNRTYVQLAGANKLTSMPH